MSTNALTTNQKLTIGESLVSYNGHWRATLQGNGNLVIIRVLPLWNSKSKCTDGSQLIVQADGDVVIQNKCGKARWATDTGVLDAQMDCRFELTNDGDLVLTQNGKKTWTSATSDGCDKCPCDEQQEKFSSELSA